MKEYFSELCRRYNICISEETLKLFTDLFADVEYIESTETSLKIDGDYLISLCVKYGEDKDKTMRINFHLWKWIDDKEIKYRLGGAYGDFFFYYNEEYYVVYDLDVDELDDETSQFYIACYGKEKIAEAIKKNDLDNNILPDHLYFNCVEADFDALYTRFSPEYDRDCITIALKSIEAQKEDPTRAKNYYKGE